MLCTPFCDLLGLDAPVVQAAIPPYTSPALVAEVSNAGGLGSYATALKPLEYIRQDIARIRELTDRPFAVNFLLPAFDPDVFEYVISEPPAVISFAVGNPGDKIHRAHEAGARVIAQVHTVDQAREVAAAGADVIVAQGAEAGGLSGSVSLMALLPQVVDAVHPLPVIAAGGIADGRGLAAALVLGAQGVNVGTRFIASAEAATDDARRQRVVDAQSHEAVKPTILTKLISLPADAYDTSMRSLRTSFLDQWESRETIEPEELDALRRDLLESGERNRLEEAMFAAGQSVGLIDDVLPAGEIVRRMVSEAETALASVPGFAAPAP